MAEVAINIPLDANEIKDIACQEFRKRLDGLGPLQGGKEYAGFDVTFHADVRLYRTGDVTAPKETLAWGSANGGTNAADENGVVGRIHDFFKSGDPNEERLARDMPLTVEKSDGHGGKTRERVRIKQ